MERSPSAAEEIPAEIRLHDDTGREFIILGADYIGLDNSDFASWTIERERPEGVCLDLDGARAKILTDEAHWESLTIREVIKEKLMTALLLNLLLAAYVRKLGDASGRMPGAELAKAKRAAEDLSIPITLADRDLNITYNRASRSINYRQKLVLLQMAIRRLFRYGKVSSENNVELNQTDVFSAFLAEVIRFQPALAKTLIGERDQYTVQKMMAASGDKIVAVISAGRVEGIQQSFSQKAEFTAADLEEVPETSPVKKWATRIIPILMILAIIYVGWTQGGDFVRENLAFWIVANSLFTGIGAILARGHILTVLTAVVVAPISPLIPAGPGTVAAIVQIILRPPLVKDFQTFADDVTQLRHWRKNRIIRIFLILILCGLGSLIGTLLGTSKIVFSFLSLN